MGDEADILSNLHNPLPRALVDASERFETNERLCSIKAGIIIMLMTIWG